MKTGIQKLLGAEATLKELKNQKRKHINELESSKGMCTSIENEINKNMELLKNFDNC